jgi:hypothetical protein
MLRKSFFDLNRILYCLHIYRIVSRAYEDIPHIQDLNILVSGDFYFHNFLSSKVKLTE